MALAEVADGPTYALGDPRRPVGWVTRPEYAASFAKCWNGQPITEADIEWGWQKYQATLPARTCV